MSCGWRADLPSGLALLFRNAYTVGIPATSFLRATQICGNATFARPTSMNTYSIALRVRRVTYEDAYIAVPITDAIVTKAEDGSLRVDVEAMSAEGIRISQDGRVEWQVESINI